MTDLHLVKGAQLLQFVVDRFGVDCVVQLDFSPAAPSLININCFGQAGLVAQGLATDLAAPSNHFLWDCLEQQASLPISHIAEFDCHPSFQKMCHEQGWQSALVAVIADKEASDLSSAMPSKPNEHAANPRSMLLLFAKAAGAFNQEFALLIDQQIKQLQSTIHGGASGIRTQGSDDPQAGDPSSAHQGLDSQIRATGAKGGSDRESDKAKDHIDQEASALDIAHQHLGTRSVRQLQLLSNVFDRINDGIVALDSNWCYTYLNQRAVDMLQQSSADDLIGKNIWKVFPDGVGQPFHQMYLKAYEAQEPILFEEHYAPWDLWFENRIYPSKNGLTIYFTEITERKKNEERLRKMAHYDALTGLPNRVILYLRLEHAMEQANRNNSMLGLIMLDLDHFKNVNDSFGHAAGDQLLQKVADTLSERFRSVDTICRLGGDEFTILIEDLTERETAARIAIEIIDILKTPWKLTNNIEVRIGASIGISLYPEHGDSPEELLQHADTSLYQAKSEGRGEYKYYSHELTRTVRRRIEVERKLRKALEERHLEVHFQPKLQLHTQTIVGAEVLVRWRDPEQGIIPPNEFISVAETTGLIVDVGNFVLKEACLQGKAWLDAGRPPIGLAVNLSTHQLLHSNIPELVRQTLAETKFPAKYLELEITESALMEREAEALVVFQQLRSMGIGLAIDDFGTGYSSLAYLKKFPLDSLKIDKSFIDDIPSSPDDRAITSTIIAMAKILNLSVVAEGVENQEQLMFLKDQDCEFFQGYYCSPALIAQEFDLLRSKDYG